MTLLDLLQSVPKRDREDAIWLLCSKLNVNRSSLFLDGSRVLDAAFLKRWREDWRRRGAGEPLQFIVGSAPFYGREFIVNRDTLVPRPETEILVELALMYFPEKERRVVDLGTGSGAIALTLKAERPDWEVQGSDISPAALEVATANARALGVAVKFQRENFFGPKLASQQWDLVISNPPYLDLRRDKVSSQVRKWEPKIALEPTADQRPREKMERAAWAAENILISCAAGRVGCTFLELSPRIAYFLERRWRRHVRVSRVWRAADLAGRKRFLLVAWKNA